MKTVFKRIAAATAVAVALAAALVFDVPKKLTAAADTSVTVADETHTHKTCIGSDHEDCTHEDVVYKPFPYELFADDNHQVIIRENVYLTEDIELDEVWGRIFVEPGSSEAIAVNLCLNGHSITKNGSEIIGIYGFLKDGSTTESRTTILNICDCQGGGCIKNTSENAEYSCVDVSWDSMLNLYSGTIESRSGNAIEVHGDENNGQYNKYGSANIYGGTVRSSGGNEYTAVWLHGPDRSFNVYGGEITAENSNTIYVQGERNTVTISGGKVVGKSEKYETVCVDGNGAVININGGSVIGENCGAAYCKNGTVNITGGEVSTKGSTATCIYNNDALNIFGGTISCDGFYAVTNRSGGTTTVSGGEIKSVGSAVNNKANSKVNISGGKISSDNYYGIYNYGSLEIADGEIVTKGNYAIYNYPDGDITIEGGKIDAAGSAMRNDAGGVVKISGGNISSAKYYGIYNYGSLEISDGEITAKGNYTIDNYDGAYLKINGGTVKSENYLLYNRSGSTAEINGGKFTAVYHCVWNNGTLDITGGEFISTGATSYNTVENYVTLNISGGEFKSPSASDARYIKNNGVMSLSGSPIFNNTALWLYTDDNIGITGTLTCSAPVNVYIESSTPRIFTSGWNTYMTGKEPSDYFKSPYNLCTVAESDGEAVLRRFVITFDPNGGSCPLLSTNVNDDGQVNSFPEAAQKGCTFDGWFTAEDGGEKVTEATVFTGDATLYAHWSECDHIWSDTYESDDDQHWKVCTKCGAEDKTNHHWNSGEETASPTCTENGEMLYTCTACGQTKTEEIPANGHTEAIDSAVAPTCMDTGLTEGSHCSVCDTVINAQEEIPALGHDRNGGETTLQPTCIEKGVVTFTCKRCGEKKTEEIPANGHTEAIDSAVAPTCTETGLTEGSHCSVCDTVINAQEEIPAPGHDWNEGIVTTEPTENSDGVMTYSCTVCGTTRTETIPAAGKPDEPEENGSISAEVLPGKNAPETELKTPLDELINAVLTPDEQKMIENGVNIKIVLTVEDGTDYAPAEDKAKIEVAINGLDSYKLGQYLDVKLLKVIGNIQEKITETNAPVTITFYLPEALRGEGRNYSVIRVHNGETDVLPDLDGDENTLTIKTDKFSTYALVYSEKTNESDPASSESVPAESVDAPSESGSSPGTDNNDNPSTGIAVSLVPLAVILAGVIVGINRKRSPRM